MSGFVFACSSEEQPPQDLIDENIYIDLMAEMQMVKSLQETVAPDSNFTDSLVPRIMNKYNVTESQFKKSHVYYRNQTEQQEQRINEAIERLRMDRVSRDTSARAPQLQ